MERLPILWLKLLASRPPSTLPTKIHIIKWNQPSLVATEYTRQISISNKATSRNTSLMLNPWYNLNSPMWENTKRRGPQSYLRVPCPAATTTPTTHQPHQTSTTYHPRPRLSTTIHIIPHPRHLDNTCTYIQYMVRHIRSDTSFISYCIMLYSILSSCAIISHCFTCFYITTNILSYSSTLYYINYIIAYHNISYRNISYHIILLYLLVHYDIMAKHIISKSISYHNMSYHMMSYCIIFIYYIIISYHSTIVLYWSFIIILQSYIVWHSMTLHWLI